MAVKRKTYKRKRKTYRRKRKMYKRKKSRIPRINIRSGMLYPIQARTMMKYSDIFAVEVPVTTVINFHHQVFRANSLYDPDYSGGGHQPWGRDNFKDFYKKCLVESSIIVVRIISMGTLCALHLITEQRTDYLAIVYGTGGIAGMNECTPARQVYYQTNAVPMRQARITSNYNYRRWFLSDKSAASFEFGYYPSKQVYYELAMTNFGTETKTCVVGVDIYYRCLMYDQIRADLHS